MDNYRAPRYYCTSEHYRSGLASFGLFLAQWCREICRGAFGPAESKVERKFVDGMKIIICISPFIPL